MVKVMIPSWKDFEEVVKDARTELIICSPFYSGTGLDHMRDNLIGGVPIQLYTRISPSDWANRISDPEALLQFLQNALSKGHTTELYVNQRIHAKVYVADRERALVGSSNLSDGGFEQNLEMMVSLDGEVVGDIADIIKTRIKAGARKVRVKDLKAWIKRHKKQVKEVRRAAEGFQAKKLSGAQRDLDRMLGHGGRKSKIKRTRAVDLRNFFIWLKKKGNLAGAKVLISRHENTDGQNLQGHVRQCFFGALQFLIENPALQIPLSQGLNSMNKDDVYQLTDPISDAWLKHIDKYATDAGEGYDYAILRGILPPSVGGTRLGGGGGISTLKRMLPLVARYLQEHRR